MIPAGGVRVWCMLSSGGLNIVGASSHCGIQVRLTAKVELACIYFAGTIRCSTNPINKLCTPLLSLALLHPLGKLFSTSQKIWVMKIAHTSQWQQNVCTSLHFRCSNQVQQCLWVTSSALVGLSFRLCCSILKFCLQKKLKPFSSFAPPFSPKHEKSLNSRRAEEKTGKNVKWKSSRWVCVSA